MACTDADEISLTSYLYTGWIWVSLPGHFSYEQPGYKANSTHILYCLILLHILPLLPYPIDHSTPTWLPSRLPILQPFLLPHPIAQLDSHFMITPSRLYPFCNHFYSSILLPNSTPTSPPCNYPFYSSFTKHNGMVWWCSVLRRISLGILFYKDGISTHNAYCSICLLSMLPS